MKEESQMKNRVQEVSCSFYCDLWYLLKYKTELYKPLCAFIFLCECWAQLHKMLSYVFVHRNNLLRQFVHQHALPMFNKLSAVLAAFILMLNSARHYQCLAAFWSLIVFQTSVLCACLSSPYIGKSPRKSPTAVTVTSSLPPRNFHLFICLLSFGVYPKIPPDSQEGGFRRRWDYPVKVNAMDSFRS